MRLYPICILLLIVVPALSALDIKCVDGKCYGVPNRVIRAFNDWTQIGQLLKRDQILASRPLPFPDAVESKHAPGGDPPDYVLDDVNDDDGTDERINNDVIDDLEYDVDGISRVASDVGDIVDDDADVDSVAREFFDFDDDKRKKNDIGYSSEIKNTKKPSKVKDADKARDIKTFPKDNASNDKDSNDKPKTKIPGGSSDDKTSNDSSKLKSADTTSDTKLDNLSKAKADGETSNVQGAKGKPDVKGAHIDSEVKTVRNILQAKSDGKVPSGKDNSIPKAKIADKASNVNNLPNLKSTAKMTDNRPTTNAVKDAHATDVKKDDTAGRQDSSHAKDNQKSKPKADTDKESFAIIIQKALLGTRGKKINHTTRATTTRTTVVTTTVSTTTKEVLRVQPTHAAPPTPKVTDNDSDDYDDDYYDDDNDDFHDDKDDKHGPMPITDTHVHAGTPSEPPMATSGNIFIVKVDEKVGTKNGLKADASQQDYHTNIVAGDKRINKLPGPSAVNDKRVNKLQGTTVANKLSLDNRHANNDNSMKAEKRRNGKGPSKDLKFSGEPLSVTFTAAPPGNEMPPTGLNVPTSTQRPFRATSSRIIPPIEQDLSEVVNLEELVKEELQKENEASSETSTSKDVEVIKNADVEEIERLVAQEMKVEEERLSIPKMVTNTIAKAVAETQNGQKGVIKANTKDMDISKPLWTDDIGKYDKKEGDAVDVVNSILENGEKDAKKESSVEKLHQDVNMASVKTATTYTANPIVKPVDERLETKSTMRNWQGNAAEIKVQHAPEVVNSLLSVLEGGAGPKDNDGLGGKNMKDATNPILNQDMQAIKVQNTEATKQTNGNQYKEESAMDIIKNTLLDNDIYQAGMANILQDDNPTDNNPSTNIVPKELLQDQSKPKGAMAIGKQTTDEKDLLEISNPFLIYNVEIAQKKKTTTRKRLENMSVSHTKPTRIIKPIPGNKRMKQRVDGEMNQQKDIMDVITPVKNIQHAVKMLEIVYEESGSTKSHETSTVLTPTTSTVTAVNQHSDATAHAQTLYQAEPTQGTRMVTEVEVLGSLIGILIACVVGLAIYARYKDCLADPRQTGLSQRRMKTENSISSEHEAIYSKRKRQRSIYACFSSLMELAPNRSNSEIDTRRSSSFPDYHYHIPESFCQLATPRPSPRPDKDNTARADIQIEADIEQPADSSRPTESTPPANSSPTSDTFSPAIYSSSAKSSRSAHSFPLADSTPPANSKPPAYTAPPTESCPPTNSRQAADSAESVYRLSLVESSRSAHSFPLAESTPPADSKPHAYTAPPTESCPPTNSRQAADSAESVYRLSPVESSRSAHSLPLAESTPPADSKPPAYTAPPTESCPPTNSRQAADSAESVYRLSPVESSRPVHSFQTESTPPAKSCPYDTQPANSSPSSDTILSAKYSLPAESSRSAHSLPLAESTPPADSKPPAYTAPPTESCPPTNSTQAADSAESVDLRLWRSSNLATQHTHASNSEVFEVSSSQAKSFPTIPNSQDEVSRTNLTALWDGDQITSSLEEAFAYAVGLKCATTQTDIPYDDYYESDSDDMVDVCTSNGQLNGSDSD